MKKQQTISQVMTPFPHSIGADIEISVAAEKLRELGVRHLPVRKGGELVGILTDRDVKISLSFGKPEKVLVQEAMTPDPFTVAPETSLREAVQGMAEHKYGCVLVVDAHGKLQGIFTATDGLKMLAEKLG